MKLQLFDGGLSTRLAPQLIQQNEAREYENIDNEIGILAPVKSKTPTTIAVQKFPVYYDAQAEWVSSNVFRDYVEFEKTLYWTDRVGRPQKYNGTNQYNLGIDAPTTAPTVTSSSSVEAPTEADFIPGSSGDLPSTTHYYVLVNDDGTFVSAPLRSSIDLVNNRINLDEEDIEQRFGRFDPGVTRYVITSDSTTRSVLIRNVKGITYGSNGVKVYRLYAGTYRLVGSLANDAATLNDTTYDISANDAFDETEVAPISGTIQYLYTYYNSADGTESAPSPASAEQEILSSVSLTNIQVSSDPQVDQKRIYRIGGNITTFTLVDTITNATTIYLDEKKDTEVEGSILTASTNTEAPTGLAFLKEAYAMLFGAEGTKLRFTPIGEPDYWPETFFLQFSTPLTGIAPVTNGVLIFTQFKTHLITGTGPTSLSQYLLDGNQGCVDASSIQIVKGSAIWASTDGICTSNGSSVSVITKNKLGKIALSPVDSTVHDQVYYLLETSGSILAVDYRYTQVIKRLSLDIESLAVGQDILYGVKNGVLQSLFSSSSVESFKYTSPTLVEGRKSERKQYKKVYIYSKGDIIFNILINGVIVATKELTDEDSHQIQVPQDKQRGNDIQFQISGTGEVHEIEYEASRRVNE